MQRVQQELTAAIKYTNGHMIAQKGDAVTDDETFYDVAFALSGNLSGFLIISLVKSISITGQ